MGVCFNSLTSNIKSSINSFTQSGFEVPLNKPMTNTLDPINEPRIGQSCNFDDLNNGKPSIFTSRLISLTFRDILSKIRTTPLLIHKYK